MLKGPAECCVGRTLNVMLYLPSPFLDFDRQVRMICLPSVKECFYSPLRGYRGSSSF